MSNYRLEQRELPNIETFEQLAEVLGGDIAGFGDNIHFIVESSNGDIVQYFKDDFSFYFEEIYLGSIKPQQAYNIICCLQKNLKGIRVCKEWFLSSSSFYDWALENGYKQGLSLDRINNNGNYEPSNCRWVDFTKQMNNRRNSVKIEYKDKIYSITELSELTKIKKATIRNRLKKGMTIDELVNPEKLNKWREKND